MSESLKVIGSSIAKLRALLGDARKDLQLIQTLLSSLTATLDTFWDDVAPIISDDKLWRETISVIASGRTLSVAAQAEEALSAAYTSTVAGSRSWIGDGTKYARWLGHGVVVMITERDTDKHRDKTLRAAAQLFGKALSLGHTDSVVEVVIDELVLDDHKLVQHLQVIISFLSTAERKRFLMSTLNIIESRYFAKMNSPDGYKHGVQSKASTEQKHIGGTAALLKSIAESTSALEDDISEWVVSNPCSHSLTRAILAASAIPIIKKILQRAWARFGDKLRIKHTPVFQQEHTAQLLLLSVGYVQRVNPVELKSQARSTIHANAMSAHLGSSSPRVRFLGMVVGMAVSELVDPIESRLKFDTKNMEENDAEWYLRLTSVDDGVGSLADLVTPNSTKSAVVPRTVTLVKTKLASVAKPLIMEVVGSEDEDEDLRSYNKPDSDREDEDEDPTLVQRNKPKAPVYVRDLIAGLQDSENYERHFLALSTAATLIRRKAGFGAELKDFAEELAGVLTGLGDPFSIEGWHEMRQEAMIATVTAEPRQMAPWYTKSFFIGDYSISQRASILVTLGLSAQDLAGLRDNDKNENPFPSRRLPDKLQKLYGNSSEVDALARRLEQTMLRPLTTKQKKKSVKNQLAAIVAESFFFPLTGYWQSVAGSSNARRRFEDPFLLSLFLKTLAIIMAASGPFTMALPRMTSEFWQLAFSLRSQALRDPAVLEAELFSFLTILNVNEDSRQLAAECSGELLETQEWVGMVYEKLSTADEEGERCKVLAAGVLVAIKEVVDKYQRFMAGSLALM